MAHTALQDRFGLLLSTSSPTAAERYVEGIERQLSQNAGAEASLQAALEAEPGFALAQADLAYVQFYQRRPEAARASAARAVGLVGGVSRRERQHVQAVATLVHEPPARAEALLREHLAEFPRDGLAALIAFQLTNGNGRIDRREQALALLEELRPSHAEEWWFLASYAFVHHELDRYDESRRYAERSLRLYPRNGNAAHSLAHVFFETSDHGGGAGFLSPWLAEYDRAAPFLCHLTWHLALFELHQGHEQRVLELYERTISPAAVQNRTTLEDSASLLWRYQLYGCTPRELPWAEVCAFAGRMTATPGQAFLDAHAALAYVAMGDEAALGRLIDGLRALAAGGNGLAEEVVLPLTLGLRAFGQGDYAEAIRRIEPLERQIVRLGGSHAQREVFEDTLLQAYFRTARWDQAAALLRKRLKQRSSPRDLVWLDEAETARTASA